MHIYLKQSWVRLKRTIFNHKNQTMNYKKECLMLAKKQFIIDIQKDIDFIEFKKNCYKGNSINYGCIVVSDSSWLLNCGISSQTIISKYYKEILHT